MDRRAVPDRRVAQADIAADRRTVPRRRGRPQVREATDERIDLYLPAADYDALCKVARALFESNVRGTARHILRLGIAAASNRIQGKAP
jgi:hypothetical protein